MKIFRLERGLPYVYRDIESEGSIKTARGWVRRSEIKLGDEIWIDDTYVRVLAIETLPEWTLDPPFPSRLPASIWERLLGPDPL